MLFLLYHKTLADQIGEKFKWENWWEKNLPGLKMLEFGPTKNHDLDPGNEINEQVKEIRKTTHSCHKNNLRKELQAKICPIEILEMIWEKSKYY